MNTRQSIIKKQYKNKRSDFSRILSRFGKPMKPSIVR